MKNELKCAAGRREFNRGRYMIEIANEATVETILGNFKRELGLGNTTACLMVFNSARHYSGRSNVAQAFHFLAEQVASISNVPPDVLIQGNALSISLDLVCPVTNQMTTFEDFECIAFCPQSGDVNDPLYDPLMYAPFPAVNIASDVYGFSRFVAEAAQAHFGKPAYEVTDFERLGIFFSQCVDRWHRLAVSIIGAFAESTNISLCPVHVAKDNQHWIAAHKDPAFAEIKKEQHIHELPNIYATRIVDSWLDYLVYNRPYSTAGFSRDGAKIGAHSAV